ncbi:MAG: T9SS type A sorting domain-containing protein [Calditrichaeota bacterium]|nr:T9SS type A sorting domain-containing protein [Calditrichota bacterium]
MTGYFRQLPVLRLVDIDGNLILQRTYNRGENNFSIGLSLTRLRDGGLLAVGQYDDAMALVLRTDPAGNLQWRSEVQGHYWYRSVVLNREGFPVIAGGTGGPALLRKLYPDRSPPVIIERFPADSLLRVLTGDTLLFWVHAVDYQGDRINYLWLRNDDEVSRDSSAWIDFPERGEYRVECQVSDTLPGRPAHWAVEAHDLLIEAYEPDTHYLSIQRNSEIDFTLDSVAYIGDLENLRYEWMIYDSTAVRWEEVAGDDRIGIRSYAFHRTSGYALKAKVFDPNVDPVPADSVQWAIQVRGVIRAFEPNVPELSLEPRQETTFELIPFNANNDSIEYWWTLNEADTLSTQSTLSISFQDTGRYIVSGYAREQVGEEEWEEDVQRWAVNVGMLNAEFGMRNEGDLEIEDISLQIAPNPFNDQAMVMIDLGGQAFLPALRADKNARPPRAQMGGLFPVRLSLYALDGREVLRLHDGQLSPGSHTFSLSDFQTFSLPSGIYFLLLQTGSHSRTVKAVLMR